MIEKRVLMTVSGFSGMFYGNPASLFNGGCFSVVGGGGGGLIFKWGLGGPMGEGHVLYNMGNPDWLLEIDKCIGKRSPFCLAL